MAAEGRDQPVDGEVTLKINHKGTSHTYTFPSAATVADLSSHIAETLSIPESNQKYLISPKPGMLKPPFDASTTSGSIPLHTLASRKITLLGSTAAEIASLDSAIQSSQKQLHHRPGGNVLKPKTLPRASPGVKTLSDAIAYSFMQMRPLPYLPNPERSLRFLQRLADDPGIKHVMIKHKWTVGLLTEMNPAEHTTHESRTLGLNRNAGEVIELRLRTDAYDGYRDYKTIRKTLCHELTHNVHGEHDRSFWDLCKQVEKEVDAADYSKHGRTVGDDEFYNPNDGGVPDEVDGGRWTGGSYVLGGGAPPLDRQEVIARAADAAEARARKEKDDRDA